MRTAILFSLLILLAACTQSISEIKSDEYLGETVRVKGTAENTVKIGELSGYTLVDDNGNSIVVSSERLPAEGDSVTARGVLKTGIFGVGYYIDTTS